VLEKLLSTATTNAKLVLAATAGAALVAGGSAVAISNVADSSTPSAAAAVDPHASDQDKTASAAQGDNRSDTATATIGSHKPAPVTGSTDKPANHGACVSAAARTKPAAGAAPSTHGKTVSAVAQSDCNKAAASTTDQSKDAKSVHKPAKANSHTDDADTADDANEAPEAPDAPDSDSGAPSSNGTTHSQGHAGGH
jgi:hypothetical protein